MYLFKPFLLQNVFKGEKNFKNIIDRVYIHHKIFVRNYTPRRALLYVPGDSEKKISKALNMDVDCVVMDCEDGVAMIQKNKARDLIHEFLNKDRSKFGIQSKDKELAKPGYTFDWAVRVNPVDTPLITDDLMSVLTAKNAPDTIVLPKVNSPEDINTLSDRIRNTKFVGPPLNLLLIIESAIAMLNVQYICQSCLQSNLFNLSGLIFGSDDLCASIGAIRTEDSKEILYARQKIVMVAKAFNLQAIDMVYIDFKDLFGFKNDCIAGMKMGYTGKQVIHPTQVPVAHESFLPTKIQIDWATGLIQAFNEHQKKGIGAFSYKNSMIDMPTIKIAQNIVDIINKTQAKQKTAQQQ